MSRVCHIAAPVVTEEILRQQHQGQEELCLSPAAVITPTGWDYIRQHHLKVARGEPEPAIRPPEPGLIPEVRPGTLVPQGGCEHPDRPCGCQTEEFGSGFVEPAACADCAIHHLQQEGAPNTGCQGCNRHKTLHGLVAAHQISAPDEELVRLIVDQVLARLAPG